MRVTAAIDDAEHVVMRDFLHEANAARAEDAALVVERDARAEIDVLRLLHLVLEEADSALPYSTLNSCSWHSPA